MLSNYIEQCMLFFPYATHTWRGKRVNYIYMYHDFFFDLLQFCIPFPIGRSFEIIFICGNKHEKFIKE